MKQVARHTSYHKQFSFPRFADQLQFENLSEEDNHSMAQTPCFVLKHVSDQSLSTPSTLDVPDASPEIMPLNFVGSPEIHEVDEEFCSDDDSDSDSLEASFDEEVAGKHNPSEITLTELDDKPKQRKPPMEKRSSFLPPKNINVFSLEEKVRKHQS
jgi:hypothetical protein